ncbi:MAG: hypothetical protein IIY81_04595, partial [Lachnospiraceae bacterium]|nr:hypothetical protein [Lachnospiraceae bacterium]
GKAVWNSSVGTKCLRDPYIFKGEDGLYHLLATDMKSSLRGKEIDEITKEICDLYISNSTKINFDVDIFKSFENIRDKVVFKLINTKANKKLLRDIPHIDFLDLSIVFYCMFDNEYLGSATALIHNIHVNMWEITVEEL